MAGPATSPPLPDPLRFLALVGERLGSSLDYADTLAEVARLAVPGLGDMCIVDIVEGGVVQRIATTHVEPAKAGLLEELRRNFTPGPTSPQPAARVMRSGEPELLTEVTPEVLASHVTNEEHASLIRRIGIRSHMAIPLVWRGSVLGAVSLGITESSRRYTEDDLVLAVELGRRAALAIENARLYHTAIAELKERRRVEEALRLSEARSRAVIEQSPLSTQILDASGMTLRVNRAWEELWGITLEHVRDYNIRQDPQLEARGVASYLARAFAGEAVEIPAIRYDPNQTLADRSRHAEPARWVRAFAYPLRDVEGTVREVVLVHEDVTRHVFADAQIRAVEQRLQLALTGARMNVWDWDLRTDIVACSEHAREFWGVDVGTAGDFLAVIHPMDLARVHQMSKDAIEHEAPYDVEYRLLDAQQNVRWVQSRGHVLRELGIAARIVGVTIDITERKATEDASTVLARAGEILGASLDVTRTLGDVAAVVVPQVADWCAVDLVSEDGKLERAAVFHQDPDKVAIAERLFSQFPPRKTDPYGAWNVIQTGKPELADTISDDLLASVSQGDEHLALLRRLALRSYVSVPLRAQAGTIGVITLVREQGDRPYSERDLSLVEELGRRIAVAVDNARLYQRLRDQDRRKDEFLATLAHELRNPLAPVCTGIELLSSAKDPTAARSTLAIMQRQVTHMVHLIDDLVDVARITRGKIDLEREQLDLNSVLDSGVEQSQPVLEAAGIELSVHSSGEQVWVDGDRTRLAQVLGNLLNNAAKYTPRGGRVTVACAQEGTDAVLRVTDTGMGIADDKLAHVFEMFTQLEHPGRRAQGGLGIGLTLARRLVELHGGKLWAESAGVGHGSTFVLRLPAIAMEGREAVATSSSPHTNRRSRLVLVVDDNVDAGETLSALMELEGHEVRYAASAEAALGVIAEFIPDVALLDIGLPGMSGYDLARHLRADARFARAVLVAVTGWAQELDRARSRDAGFDVHLTKPVNLEALRRVLAGTSSD